MSKEKPNEAAEIFSIISDTINGANFDDLCDAAHRIVHIEGYRKQSEVAREIFEEIRKEYELDGMTYLDEILCGHLKKFIDELEKKYTEGEK